MLRSLLDSKFLAVQLQIQLVPQRAQALTQFAVDFAGTGKIMNAVGGVLGITQSQQQV